jgi:DNA-binding MarR family transcriptional regulator
VVVQKLKQGELDRHPRRGHLLVQDRVDSTERRKKILKLTSKGEEVVSRLGAVFDQAVPAKRFSG